MDILFAATELAPYAKVAGLAEFVASLSKTLRQLGHHVTIALPRFPHFERAGLLVARRLTPLAFQLGTDSFEVTVFDGRLPSGVDITLLEVPGCFDREGIYGAGDEDYPDNDMRFALFSRAVVALLLSRMRAGSPFGIVHLHDWPTSLVPLFGKRLGNQDLEECTKFVLTLHDLTHQRLSDASKLDQLGIGGDLFHPDGVEFYGKINILKAGILFSDAMTTVSETYAREILKSPHGRGLEGVLSAHKNKLTGIINGIDYSIWNPTIDPHLPSRFSGQDPSQKTQCKGRLLQELGLALRAQRPLLAFAGTLHEQNGIDLLLDALPEIMRCDVGLVVAGHGTGAINARLEEAARKWKDDFVFLSSPSDPMLHRIFGGADIVLVPSRFEPCGVYQRYAHRYGAVPVVHATGGLIDTVVDCDATLETGSGFVFDEPTAQSLVSAVQRAVASYALPGWARLRKRVMNLDLGWDRSAHRYLEIYRSLLR
ncbi:MAG TPA: glycogen/starch synthase [Polyangiaceae bacterium]|nr:glycogen/starch synthase [Polyangiaceae bacterium]